jgi:hypothetical protein
MIASLLWLIAVSSSIGSYLLPINIFGINLYLFRLLVLLFPVVLLISSKKIKDHGTFDTILLLFFWLWITVALIKSIFTSDIESGISDEIAIISYLLLFFTSLFSVGSARKKANALSTGFLMAFYITAIVAIWEIITKNHLHSTFMDQMPNANIRILIYSTFGNPNNYGAFLVLVVPIIYYYYHLTKTKSTRLLATVALIAAPILIILTGSRLSMIACFIELILILRLEIRILKNRRAYLILSIFVIATFYILYRYSQQIFIISKLLVIKDELNGGSFEKRANLFKDALFMISRSPILGGGAGSFANAANKNLLPYDTFGLFSPHSLILEIGSQYGFIVMSMFIWILANMFFRSRSSFSRGEGFIEYQATRIFILCLGLVSFATSNYILQGFYWICILNIYFIYSAARESR